MYSTILVPHDASSVSDLALPHAAVAAQNGHAKIILLSVIDVVDTEIAFSPAPMASPYFNEDIIEDTEDGKKGVGKELERVKKELLKQGVKNVEIMVVEGKARDAIIDTARKEKADLIIIATNERKGLGRVLLGSIADHVVRNASCPVLVVKGDKN